LEECEEEVEKVDSKGVGDCEQLINGLLRTVPIRPTNVPALCDQYSQEEYEKEETSANPPKWRVRSRFVEPCLVLLLGTLAFHMPYFHHDATSVSHYILCLISMYGQ